MRIRSRWAPRVAGLILSVVMRVWFATCRKVFLSPDPSLRINYRRTPADTERFILCVWHDAVMVPIFAAPAHARRQTCCLVSQHQDGSFLAEALRRLEYSTVRGSSKRGGAQALKQLITDTDGKNIVISPDGPRGPRREMKAGAIYLASQTGRRIVPGGYAAKRAWRIQASWTDLLVPLPFTTVYVVSGEPIAIPPDQSREELEVHVARVQQAMQDWTDYAERVARGEAVAPPVAGAATESARNRAAA